MHKTHTVVRDVVKPFRTTGNHHTHAHSRPITHSALLGACAIGLCSRKGTGNMKVEAAVEHPWPIASSGGSEHTDFEKSADFGESQ
jgi:hypothetical protein